MASSFTSSLLVESDKTPERIMRAFEFITEADDVIQPVTNFNQLEKYIKLLKPTEKFYRIHGNYCGPGNRGGQPVDSIDSACRLHDVCYMINGYHDPICDKELVDWILRINPKTLSPYQRKIQWAIVNWFDQKLKRSGNKKV